MGKASVHQMDHKVLVIPRGFPYPDCCVGRHQAQRAHRSIFYDTLLGRSAGAHHILYVLFRGRYRGRE